MVSRACAESVTPGRAVPNGRRDPPAPQRQHGLAVAAHDTHVRLDAQSEPPCSVGTSASAQPLQGP